MKILALQKKTFYFIVFTLSICLQTRLHAVGTFTTVMYIDGNDGELSFLWNNMQGGDWGQGDTAQVTGSGGTGTGITGVTDFVSIGGGEIITFHTDGSIRKYGGTGSFNEWTQVSSVSTSPSVDTASIARFMRLHVAHDTANNLIYYINTNRQISVYDITAGTATDLPSTQATDPTFTVGSLEYYNGTLYSAIDPAGQTDLATINTTTGAFTQITTADYANLYADPVSGDLLGTVGAAQTGELAYDLDGTRTRVPVVGTISDFFTHNGTTYTMLADGRVFTLAANGQSLTGTSLFDVGTDIDFSHAHGDVQILVPEPTSVSYIILSSLLFMRRKRKKA